MRIYVILLTDRLGGQTERAGGQTEQISNNVDSVAFIVQWRLINNNNSMNEARHFSFDIFVFFLGFPNDPSSTLIYLYVSFVRCFQIN